MKFLLDENLSPLQRGRFAAWDTMLFSVLEIGLSGAGDEEVRAAAIADQRVLLTLDADFANVLRYPPAETPGVVRLRLHPATEDAIDAMLKGAIPRVAEVMPRSNADAHAAGLWPAWSKFDSLAFAGRRRFVTIPRASEGDARPSSCNVALVS